MNWSHQFNCTFDPETLCGPDDPGRPLSEAVPRVAHSTRATSRQEKATGEILILLCKSQEATFSFSCAASRFLPTGHQQRRNESVSINENDGAGCSRLTTRVLHKHLTERAHSEVSLSLFRSQTHFSPLLPRNAKGNINGKG